MRNLDKKYAAFLNAGLIAKTHKYPSNFAPLDILTARATGKRAMIPKATRKKRGKRGR